MLTLSYLCRPMYQEFTKVRKWIKTVGGNSTTKSFVYEGKPIGLHILNTLNLYSMISPLIIN